jgi:hypothetical protein
MAVEQLKEAADWMDRYRQFWDTSFGRIAHISHMRDFGPSCPGKPG